MSIGAHTGCPNIPVMCRIGAPHTDRHSVHLGERDELGLAGVFGGAGHVGQIVGVQLGVNEWFVAWPVSSHLLHDTIAHVLSGDAAHLQKRGARTLARRGSLASRPGRLTASTNSGSPVRIAPTRKASNMQLPSAPHSRTSPPSAFTRAMVRSPLVGSMICHPMHSVAPASIRSHAFVMRIQSNAHSLTHARHALSSRTSKNVHE